MASIIYRTMSSLFMLGGLVMAGIGGWYDFQEAITNPVGPLGLSILLWGVIVYSIGGLGIIGQLWYKVKQLERAMPEIKVTPVVYNRRAILEVHNYGGNAVFRSKARLIKDKHHQEEMYTMYWESVKEGSVSIAKQGTETLLVAEQFMTDLNPMTSALRMFKMGTSGEQHFLVGFWISSDQVLDSTGFPHAVFKDSVDDVYLEVSISAEPALKNSFRKTYRIHQPSIDNLVFEEVNS